MRDRKPECAELAPGASRRTKMAAVMDLATEHLKKGGMCVMAAHQDVEIGAEVKRVSL